MMIPDAEPAVPSNVYHAKISLRIDDGVSCASVDSSIALNGPISLPLADSEPLAHDVPYYTEFQRSIEKREDVPGAYDTKDACGH